MMATESIDIRAIYEDGVLKPLDPLELEDKQVVSVRVTRTISRPGLTGHQLLGSDVVGLWKDREDIQDNVEYARWLREQAQRRRG